jgi:hypothetical protein
MFEPFGITNVGNAISAPIAAEKPLSTAQLRGIRFPEFHQIGGESNMTILGDEIRKNVFGSVAQNIAEVTLKNTERRKNERM